MSRWQGDEGDADEEDENRADALEQGRVGDGAQHPLVAPEARRGLLHAPRDGGLEEEVGRELLAALDGLDAQVVGPPRVVPVRQRLDFEDRGLVARLVGGLHRFRTPVPWLGLL